EDTDREACELPYSPRKLLRRASPVWAWHTALPGEIAIVGLASRTLTDTPTFPAAPSASGTAPPARPCAADGGRRGAHGDCASRPGLTGAREEVAAAPVVVRGWKMWQEPGR